MAFARPLPFAVFAQSPAPIEQGKFILHKLEQPIGAETYQITRDGDSLAVKVDFKFTDRSSPVPLTASFRSASISLPIPSKSRVKIRARRTLMKPSKCKPTNFVCVIATNGPKPPGRPSFFHRRLRANHHADADGALLGDPRLASAARHIAQRTVKIEPRGSDTVKIDGKDQKFDRFTIEGLIWGRETLWFDANRNLVAAVTTDAEFDPSKPFAKD